MDPSEKQDFPKVHKEEKEEIIALRKNREVPESGDTYLGLALSGGGIRSATFNLGVLQSLARLEVLPCIDYLSMVSGGGYIGSWLIAWIKRAGLKKVTAGLQPDWHKHTDGKATPEIEFLRDYSNYLTPHVGFFTADTWTVIVTYIRNLLLNLLILVTAAIGVLLLPRWLVVLVPHLKGGWVPPVFIVLEILAFGFFGYFFWPALCAAGGNSATQQATTTNDKESSADESEVGKGQGPIVLLIGLCSFTSAYLAAGWAGEDASNLAWTHELLWVPVFVIALWTLLGMVLAAWLKLAKDAELPDWNRYAVFLSSLVSYALLSVPPAFWVLEKLGGRWRWDFSALVSWGVPIVVLVFLLAAALQVGLTSLLLSNEVREWTARLGAWLLILGLVWAALFGIALYGPDVFLWARHSVGQWLVKTVTVAWAVHTVVGVWSAFSSKSGNGDSGKWLNILAVTAPPVFVVGLLMWLSYGIHRFPPKPAEFGIVAAALSLFLAWLLSLRIDINEFSMHTFYRNRLVRCYLGASRFPFDTPKPDKNATDEERFQYKCRRKANRFSGFDPKDDILLASVAAKPQPGDTGCEKRKYAGPYPILNAALNLTHGRRLAWQERKAESFTFTPRYCGGTINDKDSFLPTRDYAYPHAGVYLGTAMAISGAAVSPLAGFHYSSSAGFLMTVFNARLGQWLANPRMPEITSNRFGPRFGFLWLLRELFGLINDEAPYVNLSDGGLFENLGIYELVRRRVKYIIACDAGEDRDLKFGDLGTAIRRCRSDFGVEIEIKLDDIQRDSTTKLSKSSFAVGTIHYSPGPPYDPHADGELLYLKASLTRDDPPDVLEYHSNNDDFPHQSTADQWFDESQFESYRRLGESIARAAFGGLEPPYTRDQLFKYLDDKRTSPVGPNASIL